MIAYKLTPSEIKARDRASKQKPKKIQARCVPCAGTGEVKMPGQHSSRCPACLGSGMMQQRKEQQVDGILFARSTF